MLTSKNFTITEYFRSYKIDPTLDGWDQLEVFLGDDKERMSKLFKINDVNSKVPLWIGAVARLHLLNAEFIDKVPDHWFLEKLFETNFDFMVRYLRTLKSIKYDAFIASNPASLVSAMLPFFQFYLGNSDVFVSLNDIKCYDEIKKAKIITEFWKRSINSGANKVQEICFDLKDSRTQTKYYMHFFYSFLIKKLTSAEATEMRKLFNVE